MAQVFVPGVAQTVIYGDISNHKYNQIWHFSRGQGNQPWAQLDLQALVNTIMGSMNTRFKALLAANVKVNTVTGVDLTNSTPAEAVSTPAAFQCTGASNVSPGICALVNFNIPQRYKGGHPRTYFPPMASSSFSANTDAWSSAACTSFASAMSGLIQDIITAISGVNHVAINWTYTTTVDPTTGKQHRERTGVRAVSVVSSYTVNPPFRSQRRRIQAAT